MKKMSELMRERMNVALAENTDKVAASLFQEVMEEINIAATHGEGYFMWKGFVRHYNNGGYEKEALRKVEDMLEEEGFHISTEGCAVHGLFIDWLY